MQEGPHLSWPEKNMRRPVGMTPYPFGHARIWCQRPDPYGPNRTDLDTKMGQPVGDALWAMVMRWSRRRDSDVLRRGKLERKGCRSLCGSAWSREC
jgi:hypothetical protein